MANLAVIYRISADISSLEKNVKRGVDSMDAMAGSAAKIGKVLAGAFTVDKLLELGRAIVADADSLQKMADKTGIGVEALQRLRVAGDDAGNTLEQLTGAINMMQRRLADGDASAVGALRRLGINFSEIRRMSPEDQFIKISDAIRDIKDPAERVNVAMDLFGRAGAETLPTLIRGFDDLKGASVGMSKESVEALDRAGDALQRWKRAFMSTASEVAGKGIIGLERALAQDLSMSDPGRQVSAANEFMLARQRGEVNQLSPFELAQLHAPDLSKGLKSLDELEEGWKNTAKATLAAASSVEHYLDSQRKLNTAAIEEANRLSRLRAENIKVDLQHRADAWQAEAAMLDFNGERMIAEIVQQYERQQEAQKRNLEIQRARQEAAWQVESDALNTHGMSVLADIQEHYAKVEQFSRASLGRTAIEARRVYEEMKNRSSEFSRETIRHFRLLALEAAAAAGDIGARFRLTFEKSLGSLNDIFQRAFEGGGGVKGAIKSFMTDFTEGFLSAIPVVGGALSQFAGAIVSGISRLFGGPSQKELEARDKQKQFIDAFRDFGAIGSDFDVLAQAADRLGLSLDALLATDDPKAFARTIDDARVRLEKLTEAVSRYGLTWQDMEDPAKRLQGFETDIGDLVDTFKMLERAGYSTDVIMGKMGQDFMRVLREAKSSGVLEGFIAQLVETGRISEDVGRKLMSIGTAVDYQELTDRARKYGIELKDLGPKFQQAHISRSADEILTDFNDLIGAGAEINGVMVGMQDEVNKLLQDAIRFGSSIPTAMEPMLRTMLGAGLLVDENGTKLEDLAGITFADSPLETGIKDLETAIRDLIEALGGVPGKITEIANTRIPAIEVPVRPIFEDGGFFPTLPTPPDVPGFQHGSGGIRDFGAGTLAMLHGREAVVTEAQMQHGGGPGVIHTHVFLNGREIAEAVEAETSWGVRSRRRLEAA